MLTLFAVVSYVATAVLALKAFLVSRSRRGHSALPAISRNVWILATLLFVIAAISRYFGIEEQIRVWFRALLRSDKLYSNRFEFQSIFASLVVIIAAAGALWSVVNRMHSGKLRRGALPLATLVAASGCATMLCLIVLRLVSFHVTDVLLFGGPRLNWFLDIGSTLSVAYAAVVHVRLLGRPRQR